MTEGLLYDDADNALPSSPLPPKPAPSLAFILPHPLSTLRGFNVFSFLFIHSRLVLNIEIRTSHACLPVFKLVCAKLLKVNIAWIVGDVTASCITRSASYKKYTK